MEQYFEYVCDRPEYPHHQESIKELARCQSFVCGEPCTANLWRLGTGAVKANKELAAARRMPVPAGLPGGKAGAENYQMELMG